MTGNPTLAAVDRSAGFGFRIPDPKFRRLDRYAPPTQGMPVLTVTGFDRVAGDAIRRFLG